MGRESIVEDWDDGKYLKSFAKAAVLPLTAAGTRFFGTLVTPIVAVGESVGDIVTFFKGSLSEEDRKFLEANEVEVSKLFSKMSRVLRFYRQNS